MNTIIYDIGQLIIALALANVIIFWIIRFTLRNYDIVIMVNPKDKK